MTQLLVWHKIISKYILIHFWKGHSVTEKALNEQNEDSAFMDECTLFKKKKKKKWFYRLPGNNSRNLFGVIYKCLYYF